MKRFSLPKHVLLTKPQEYNLVYRKGKRIQGNQFSLIFTPNCKPVNRLGISIHGQLKGAVKRNRIKRIIREFFRTNRTFLQTPIVDGYIAPPMDIVFTVRKGFRLDSPAAVAQAVNAMLAGTGRSPQPDRKR